ncbi:MAG TPA: nuclear transport factor 2 family protein [Stellaceae bacterium]|jgi:ketosteroid isomerase-like protein|nr:nuclear transport factor 2 family protein [Stellaceae bacterium]
MKMDRRQLAIAGAMALGASGLLRTSPAQAADGADPALDKAIEELRAAILGADKAKLAALTAEQLSYGHSDGRVQTKAEFIDGVVNRKAKVKTLTFPDLKVAVTGDAGVARHLYVSDSELDGKASSIKLGALQVWQKQAGGWKLLARQGFKLA